MTEECWRSENMILNVVLPNVCKMLFAIGYNVFIFIWMVPQMDMQHNKGDAFVVLLGLLVGIYGVGISIERIANAYIDKWDRERKHYLSVKNTFALFNQYYWSPDWNLRDFPKDLKEAKRLGIDKELPTDTACRLYLYGHDPEENRPPMPEFNSDCTEFILEGVRYEVPERYYGKTMDENTVKQIVDEVRSNARSFQSFG